MSDPEVTPLTPEVTPLTPDTNPTTININMKLLLVLAKAIIVSLCVQYYYTIGGYLILIFLGIYLICDAAISMLPQADFVLKMNDRNIDIKTNKTKMKLFSVAILSFIWLILELTVGPSWWPTGTVIGFILSLICLISSVSAFCVMQFKMGLHFGQHGSEYNAIHSEGFQLSQNLMNTLKAGWIGFTLNEVLKKQITQKRFVYYFLMSSIVALSVLVVIQEFVVIRNWSCKEYANEWLGGGLGWEVVSCNAHYWAGGSAAGTIVILSLLIGAVYRPTWPTTLVAGLVMLAYGVYMALLSTSTIQSLMFMGNFTHNDHPDLMLDPVTNRFLHLIPIQYIAIIMITLGFAFQLHCLSLKIEDDKSLLKKALTIILLIGIILLTVVNMTATQVTVTQQLWQHWNQCTDPYDCYPLKWPYRNVYMMYIVSTLSLSMLMFGCALMKLIHLNLKFPGALAWLVCLCHLGLAVFYLYATCHDPGYVRYEHVKDLMILKETPLWILILNFTLVFISGLFGILGLFFYGVEVLQTFCWLGAAIIFPFVCLWSFCRSQVDAVRTNKVDDQQPSAEGQATVIADAEQSVSLVNEIE